MFSEDFIGSWFCISRGTLKKTFSSWVLFTIAVKFEWRAIVSLGWPVLLAEIRIYTVETEVSTHFVSWAVGKRIKIEKENTFSQGNARKLKPLFFFFYTDAMLLKTYNAS